MLILGDFRSSIIILKFVRAIIHYLYKNGGFVPSENALACIMKYIENWSLY